jgi:hypothetical protein
MKTKIKIVTALALAFSSGFNFTPAYAVAEHGVGNGGKGYLCNGKVILLDTFEAIDRRIPLAQPANTHTVEEIVHAWLKKLDKKDDRGSTNYLVLANKILADIKSFHGQEMVGDSVQFSNFENTATDDSHEKIIPRGCQKKVQIVIQQEPKFSRDRLFRIDIESWNLMDPLQQAFTVMHEIIYNEAISDGEQNSDTSRYLNEALASDDFDHMSTCDWIRTLREARFYHYSYAGLKIDTRLNASCKDHSNGALASLNIERNVALFRYVDPAQKITPTVIYFERGTIFFSDKEKNWANGGVTVGTQGSRNKYSAGKVYLTPAGRFTYSLSKEHYQFDAENNNVNRLDNGNILVKGVKVVANRLGFSQLKRTVNLTFDLLSNTVSESSTEIN